MSALLLLAIPLLGFASCFASPRRRVAVAVGSIGVELLLAITAEANSEILGITLRVDGLNRLLVAMSSLAVAAAVVLAAHDGRRDLVPLPLLMLAPAVGALLTRATPAVAVLMLELALLATVPALVGEHGAGSPSVQRYVTAVVVGGTALLLTLGLADRYRTGHDPYLTRPVLALAVVGWGLLLAGFPFHFWLPPLCRGRSTFVAVTALAIVRPLGLGVFLGMFATLPWLLSDARSSLLLVAGGVAAALGSAVLSLSERHPLARLAYLSTADVGYILVGVATSSAPGFAGALLASMSHTLAMLLVPASLALRNCCGANIGWGRRSHAMRQIGTAGLAMGIVAVVAAPPGSGFVGRWMIYEAAWATSPISVAALLAASAVTLLSALRLGRELDLPPIAGGSRGSAGTTALALALSVALGGALVLAIGLYPAPLVDAVTTAVGELSGVPAW